MTYIRITAAAMLAGAAALTAPLPAFAQAQKAVTPMVEWVVPVTPTNKPQTEEQAEHGRQKGRELPAPEVLQPMLDTQLPEEFLRFMLSREGQQVVLEHTRYIPLRAWQANAAKALLGDGN